MRKLVLALAATIAAAGAGTAGLADTKALAFEAVAPEGLDAEAAQIVAALQANMPAQIGLFEQNGYGHYGALAVPKGVALKPELLSSVANADTPEAAQAAVLEACAQQNGTECTVIGLLVPAGA